MSDLAISNAASLTAATLAGGDLVPVLDVSAVVGSKGSQTTLDELGAYLVGNLNSTWNNAGTNFNLIYGRVTNTASGASSKFIDFGTVAAGSLFSVDKSGEIVGRSITVDYQVNCLYHWVTAQQAALRTHNYFGDGGGVGLVDGARIVWTNGAKATEGTVDVTINRYAGNPEGVLTANPGSLCLNKNGGPPYYKDTGTGNTGWVLMT